MPWWRRQRETDQGDLHLLVQVGLCLGELCPLGVGGLLTLKRTWLDGALRANEELCLSLPEAFGLTQDDLRRTGASLSGANDFGDRVAALKAAYWEAAQLRPQRYEEVLRHAAECEVCEDFAVRLVEQEEAVVQGWKEYEQGHHILPEDFVEVIEVYRNITGSAGGQARSGPSVPLRH